MGRILMLFLRDALKWIAGLTWKYRVALGSAICVFALAAPVAIPAAIDGPILSQAFAAGGGGGGGSGGGSGGGGRDGGSGEPGGSGSGGGGSGGGSGGGPDGVPDVSSAPPLATNGPDTDDFDPLIYADPVANGIPFLDGARELDESEEAAAIGSGWSTAQ